MTLIAATVVLSLSLKSGTTRIYDVTRTYSNHEFKETTVFHERVTYVVEEESEPGWFKVRRERMPIEAVYDSVRVPAPSDTVPMVLREERSARNTVRSVDPELPDPHWMERAARPLRVFYPLTELSVGETWGLKSPQSLERLPGFAVEWTLKELDDSSATVALEFTELELPLPVAASGTIVLDRASGWPKSLDVKVFNVRVPDDEEPTPVELHVVWKLRQVKPAG
jgi:hypothetical protein